MAKHEILISPGFGSGWSTWNSQYAKELLTFPPLIEAVKKGEHIKYEKVLMTLLHRHLGLECDEDGQGEIFTGSGYCTLKVVEVDQPFVINEYDGSESVQTLSDFRLAAIDLDLDDEVQG